jgi:tetratricopeptide (TPR) repeat protein
MGGPEPFPLNEAVSGCPCYSLAKDAERLAGLTYPRAGAYKDEFGRQLHLNERRVGMQNTGQGNPARRNPRTIEGKARPMPNASHQKALSEYQNALQWMHEGKYEKARVVFERLSEEGPAEILERSRVYLVACQRRAQQSGLSFDNTEEQYDYAISLLNTGFYEEARDQFQGILKTNPAADYAYYGLAILESMTGLAEPCLEHLAKAIELSPRNRIQARSDSDFQDMADDPRFTELLYPEVP